MRMSDAAEREQRGQQEEELSTPPESLFAKPELTEAEKAFRAKVHRHMGMTAAILGLIAAGVGFWSIGRVFGFSPWAALAEAMPLFLICLAILGLGVVFSLGTSRVALGIERLVTRKNRKQKTG